MFPFLSGDELQQSLQNEKLCSLGQSCNFGERYTAKADPISLQ